MERSLESLPELTTRRIRQWFVAYRTDAYPCYGEGRLPLLSYRAFKTKTLEHHQLHQELLHLFDRYPQASLAPADARARMVHLEVQSSQLEYELCLS
ncbi:MAG TPA: hypothetical protein V6D05_10110 [Stenomitos sp.]